MKIIAINKKTGQELTLMENLTEKKANSFCEIWGWSYCDENMVTWWLAIKED